MEVTIMKKNIILSTLILALSLAACANAKEPAETIADAFELKEVVSTSGLSSRLGYSSIQQLLAPAHWGAGVLEDYSADIAVIGEFIEDASNGFQYGYNEHFGKDVVVDGFARGQFRVSEVLHGDIKEGDIITIIQRYAFDEERGALISFSELTPMHKGDRWIYFLNRNGDNYNIIAEADSRFPLPDEEIVQFIDEIMSIMVEADELIRSKEQVDSISPILDEWWYCVDKDGNLYRLTKEEIKEVDKFEDQAFELRRTVDSSAFGVINRFDFNYRLYAEIIEHFQIEVQDRVNPGREFDAKLIEMYEIQRGWIN
jgi:hypothetical protein